MTNNNEKTVLIYERYSIEDFKEIYYSLNKVELPKLVEGFIRGYTIVLKNKEAFAKFGMKDFSFSEYKKDIVNIFSDNFIHISSIDANFKNIFMRANGESLIPDLKSVLTKESKFLGLLLNLESQRLQVANAEFNQFVCYLAGRYVSYYQHKGSFYINLEDAAKSLEKAINEAYTSVKCTFQYDYGWNDVSDWLTLLEVGRAQLHSSPSMKKVVYFEDFVFNLVSKERYKRSERALNILREAQMDFRTTCERVTGNQNFMSVIEKTSVFKEFIDAYRRDEQSKSKSK